MAGMFSRANVAGRPVNKTGSVLLLIIMGILGLWALTLFEIIPDFETPLFLVILGLGLFVIAKFIIAASPKETTSTEDFVFLLVAAGAIIAIFMLFPGMVPDFLEASITEIKSTAVVQSIIGG